VNQKHSIKFLFLACSLLGPQSWAQDPAVQAEQTRLRVRSVGSNLESLSQSADDKSNRAQATPGDSDLGSQFIIPLGDPILPWRVFASASEYYTSNATLARNNKQADGYFFGEVGLRHEVKLSEDLTFEALFREGIFRYHSLTAQNFNSLNAGAGVFYNLTNLWDITLFGRYNFEWDTNSRSSRDLLTEHTLTIGAQKTFALQGNNFLYVGYSSIFGWAQQFAAQRNEHSLFLGGQAHLTKSLDADLYTRIALYDYRQGGRKDFNTTATAALTYHFNKQFSANASFTYVVNRSNRSVSNYDAATTGGGINFKYQF
jgi:hypothetical protein